MLHIIEYTIPNRDSWGGVYTFDSTLPGCINRIKGVLVNIIPNGRLSLHIESVKTESTGEEYEEGCYYQRGVIKYYAQNNLVGTCNVSLNNTDNVVTVAGCVTKELEQSSYSYNLLKLAKQKEVAQGSSIRVVFEEQIKDPFATKADAVDLMTKIEQKITEANAGYEPIKDTDAAEFRQYGLRLYGLTNISEAEKLLTNGYTLKLYIDYD